MTIVLFPDLEYQDKISIVLVILASFLGGYIVNIANGYNKPLIFGGKRN